MIYVIQCSCLEPIVEPRITLLRFRKDHKNTTHAPMATRIHLPLSPLLAHHLQP